MEKIVTLDNLHQFAYCNHAVCQRPIRGLTISFFGLGGTDMYQEHKDGTRYGQEGILLLIPYQNPWAWMNRQTVAFTDELVDALFSGLGLPEDLPIVSSGGSMGGLSALVYTAYAKHTPAACVANCPVCDLPYHFTERPDLPRTLYSAFYTYEGTLEEALRSASPLHLIHRMPDIPYTIFHCEQDKAVSKALHSDRFVEAMRPTHRMEYISIPHRGHCDLTPEGWEQYHASILHAMGD